MLGYGELCNYQMLQNVKIGFCVINCFLYNVLVGLMFNEVCIELCYRHDKLKHC